MILFSPPRSLEATELEEGEGEHCHERMAVKSLPGSPFEVVEPQLLFQLLMGLFANQTCLDGGSQSVPVRQLTICHLASASMSSAGIGPDEPHVDRIHLQVTRDTDRPSKIASREALAKRRAQPGT